MREKVIIFIITVTLLAAGVVAIIMGIDNLNKRETYAKTTAEIIRITSEYDPATEGVEKHTFIRYTVDGRQYDTELNASDPSYREGMTIGIFYSPDDPGDVLPDSAYSLSLLFVVGALLIVGAPIPLVTKLVKEAKYKREHQYDM